MLAIREILVPVAFTARCRGALRYAAALAEHFDSRLTVVHCLDAPAYKHDDSDAPPVPDGWARQHRSAVYLRLKRFLDEAIGEAAARPMLLEGDPAGEIAMFARTEAPDLIVIPTHAYGPLRRLVLGSVTASLLRLAPLPLLTGTQLARKDAVSPGNVFCAVDGTPQSEAAAKWAAGFAKSYSAKLTTVDFGEASDAATRAHAGLIVTARTHAYAIARGSHCPVSGI